MYRLADGNLADVPFPVPGDRLQADDLRAESYGYLRHQLYRFGGSTWLVRMCMANCHTAGTFILQFAGNESKVAAFLPHQFPSGLVWAVPVTLAVEKDLADRIQLGQEVALCEGDAVLAVLEVAPAGDAAVAAQACLPCGSRQVHAGGANRTGQAHAA
jgi:hypothetical protein